MLSGLLCVHKSLYGAALISLGFREQPEIISNPWRLTIQETDHPLI